jgi:hypothetical protein
MPFPNKVKEDAMFACKRCCCLCHKLKHTKMECHHIVLESDGGDNTFENCIPLCFECHGEVGAYNPKHSKGTKYTPKELRRRRDEWYEKAKNASPTLLDARHAEIDRKLLGRLCQRCSPERAKALFHDQLYGASFPRAIVEVLELLNTFGEEVESQFLDPTLESLFAELRGKVRDMLPIFSQAYPQGDRMMRLVPEDEANPYASMENRERVARQAEASAEAVFIAYTNLVRECRRKLHIDLMRDSIPG